MPRAGYFLFIFCLLMTMGGPARAIESLNYSGFISQQDKTLVEAYMAGFRAGQTQIAPTDLNADGINEFIVKYGCAAQGLCSYKVLANSDGRIILLGDMEARDIGLGNAYSGGVRNIIAFKDTVNNYQPTVYIWEPAAGRYMIKG